uniref:Uncharacterized protein n=1 Tax=Romanomermis culicivorax TaxID=13658 RepID=A0A915INL3_ROMCU
MIDEYDNKGESAVRIIPEDVERPDVEVDEPLEVDSSKMTIEFKLEEILFIDVLRTHVIKRE